MCVPLEGHVTPPCTVVCRRTISFSFALESASGRRLMQAGSECALQQYNATSASYPAPQFTPCSSPAVSNPSPPCSFHCIPGRSVTPKVPCTQNLLLGVLSKFCSFQRYVLAIFRLFMLCIFASAIPMIIATFFPRLFERPKMFL